MMNNEVSIKFKTLLAIITINFILQSTIFQGFKFGGVAANYTLILVVLITTIYDLESGLFTAFIGGLYIDVYLSMAIGLNVFILIIVAVLVSIIGKPLFTGNRLTLIVMISITTTIYHLLYFFFMYFLNKGISFIDIMVRVVPSEIIMNSIICVIGYNIAIKWIDRYKLI